MTAEGLRLTTTEEVITSTNIVSMEADPRNGMLHKPGEAIYGTPTKGRITLVMQRAYNLMLKVAAQQGIHADWYEIPASKLARDLDYNSHDMAFLEDSLDRMQTTLVKWEVRDIGTNQVIKTSVQLMGKVQFVGELSESGACLQKIIRYRFDEDIKHRLLNPQNFAVLDTALLNRFTSRYALALYEILMFTLRNNPAHEDGWTYTGSAKWEEWRDRLIGESAASSTHFTQVKYFNRDVVAKALKNIKAVAPEIEADCLNQKSGRFITHLQFKVKAAAQGAFDLEETMLPIDTSAIVSRLRALGIPHNVIQRVLRKHPLEDLEAAAQYTEERLSRTQTAGPVENVPAYFTRALSQRYWDFISPEESALNPPAKAMPAKPKPAPTQERPSISKDPYISLGQQHYEGLTDEARQATLHDFMISEASPKLISEYRTKGMSETVKKTFFNWLGRYLTAP